MTREADEMLTTKAQSQATTETRSRGLAPVESTRSAVASGCERKPVMTIHEAAAVARRWHDDRATRAAYLQRVGAIAIPTVASLDEARAIIATLTARCDEAEREARDAQSQLAAAEEEIESLREDLRVATGCP